MHKVLKIGRTLNYFYYSIISIGINTLVSSPLLSLTSRLQINHFRLPGSNPVKLAQLDHTRTLFPAAGYNRMSKSLFL